MRRVVITGVGLITALGTGTEKTWNSLLNGDCGINTIESFDTSDQAVHIAEKCVILIRKIT